MKYGLKNIQGTVYNGGRTVTETPISIIASFNLLITGPHRINVKNITESCF